MTMGLGLGRSRGPEREETRVGRRKGEETKRMNYFRMERCAPLQSGDGHEKQRKMKQKRKREEERERG